MWRQNDLIALLAVAVYILLVLFLVFAPENARSEEVCIDREIVLLADVSGSMMENEKAIQRDGYASAFRSDDVIHAIESGYCGQIAVQYVEFGEKQYTVADWTTLDGAQSAFVFSGMIEAAPPSGFGGSERTGIAEALAFAGESLTANGLIADREVIDISADGPENTHGKGPNEVRAVRDLLITPSEENGWREVQINGLPIMGGQRKFLTEEQFLRYFETNVIGGPGHFMIPAKDANEIPDTFRKKLVAEIG